MSIMQKRVPPPVRPKLFSREEAAALLGNINIRTVDRLVKRGQLKAVRLGRRNMVTRESAEALAAGE
jgi:excisionase family DNA binding protein